MCSWSKTGVCCEKEDKVNFAVITSGLVNLEMIMSAQVWLQLDQSKS